MTEEQMLQFFASKQDLKETEKKLLLEMDKQKTEILDVVLTNMDKQTAILNRLDQERIFTSEHLSNNDERLDNVEADVGVLKLQLKLT